MIGTEPRVDEPVNQTHGDLAGWLPIPMFFFSKSFVLDQILIARFVSWIFSRPLMKSFHDEGHRSLLKLCRDLCLTQGTRSVFPVLEQDVDTHSMVLVSTTEFKKGLLWAVQWVETENTHPTLLQKDSVAYQRHIGL
jgi:hypothetical protein